MEEILKDQETWVVAAFLILMVVLIAYGVPGFVVKALDARTARIKSELDAAHQLRQEAEAVLAQYRRKQVEAEKEAQAIIDNARVEAERLAEEAKAKVEDFVARRTKMAEVKIAQAEAQALADVRSAAADAAVAAAEKILVTTARGHTADALLSEGISELKSKLN